MDLEALVTDELREELRSYTLEWFDVDVSNRRPPHARVAVRNVRRDGMEMLKRLEKAHEMSEDQVKARSNEVQKVTDKHVAAIDDLLKHKSDEIMQV